MSAKKYRVLQGTIRDSDGSVKGHGDEILIADDQAERFIAAGQVEEIRQAGDASSSAGPADAA